MKLFASVGRAMGWPTVWCGGSGGRWGRVRGRQTFREVMLALKVVELMLMLMLLMVLDEQPLLLLKMIVVKLLLWRGILFHAAADICGSGIDERSRRVGKKRLQRSRAMF